MRGHRRNDVEFGALLLGTRATSANPRGCGLELPAALRSALSGPRAHRDQRARPPGGLLSRLSTSSRDRAGDTGADCPHLRTTVDPHVSTPALGTVERAVTHSTLPLEDQCELA